MYPPSQGFNLDIQAVSGILGSVSIACWVVVFSPQIIENFRRGSAEGLSVVFIVIWLLGDVFNILGAVLQGVLPTMTILAVYYTLADLVLLAQCFYYQGFTLQDKITRSTKRDAENNNPNERTALLSNGSNQDMLESRTRSSNNSLSPAEMGRRSSISSFRDRLLSVDGTHLSPVTPLLRERSQEEEQPSRPERPSAATTTTVQGILFNLVVIILVCAAGVLGWWLSNDPHSDNLSPPTDGKPGRPGAEPIIFNFWGQIFGYICALLYLGSRIPQLLLNYRRKSTDGISMMFFLFACIGNLTYVLSIAAYGPVCERPRHCSPGEAAGIYGRYIAVNFSWLLGSFGTLLLDAGVFVQYFMYLKEEEDDNDDDELDEDDHGGSLDPAEATIVTRSPQTRRNVTFDSGAT